jgi:hypothetical protein
MFLLLLSKLVCDGVSPGFGVYPVVPPCSGVDLADDDGVWRPAVATASMQDPKVQIVISIF